MVQSLSGMRVVGACHPLAKTEKRTRRISIEFQRSLIVRCIVFADDGFYHRWSKAVFAVTRTIAVLLNL